MLLLIHVLIQTANLKAASQSRNSRRYILEALDNVHIKRDISDIQDRDSKACAHL